MKKRLCGTTIDRSHRKEGWTERLEMCVDTGLGIMRVCILTDFTLPSFVRVAELYQATFKSLGWNVEHYDYTFERSRLSQGFDCIFHNVNGRNFKAVPGRKNIAFFVHEWSKYPPAWVPYLDDFDAIWTTTEHCREVAERSNLQPKAYWLPPFIEFDEYPFKDDHRPHKPFRFLYVGEWHFRKGLHILFEAWFKAFPKTGEALLTIKTSESCPFNPPRSDIEIIKENYPRKTLLKHYESSDCYISASLGEGWGLPILEAVACGLPVCANLWGGHRSMLCSSSCFPVSYREIPQPFASKPELYASEQLCGFSDESSISESLIRAYHSTVEERETFAHLAFEEIKKNYSLPSLIGKYRNFENQFNDG